MLIKKILIDFTKLNQHATILDRSYNDLSTTEFSEKFSKVCNPNFTVNFQSQMFFLMNHKNQYVFIITTI